MYVSRRSLAGVFSAVTDNSTEAAIDIIVEELNPDSAIALVGPPSSSLAGKNTKPVSGLAPHFDNEENAWGFLTGVHEGGAVGRYFFEEGWLYESLKMGKFVPFPPTVIVGGLQDAQKAVDQLKAGVSATKLVLVHG